MRILLILIFLFLSSCKFERLVDNHGTHYLEKKQKKLTINVTNKNDIINILGPPSTKDKFDNDVWLYIERKKTNQGVLALGRKKTYLNNVLLLEINNKGLLAKKEFFKINDMNKINFSESSTERSYSKRSFVYDFLSSMRQKINDPLGVRSKKRKKITQQ
tara:strand:+ start:8 stop:487 length:480 start_codon:yes stop_codon:yes gene_type:complete